MRRIFGLLAFLFIASACFAQNGNQSLPGLIPSYTVAKLPLYAATGAPAWVTDGNGYSCTTGLSTTLVLCRYGGSAHGWQPVGGGSGTGTVTQIVFSSPLSGGTITTSGTVGCATCVTSAASLGANALVVGSGGVQGTATGNADFTYATHTLTGGASGLFDLSAEAGTANFKVPSHATNTATAAAVIDFDATHNNYHVYANGADSIMAASATALGPTNLDCVDWLVSSGNILLGDTPCGGLPTLPTSPNGVAQILTSTPSGGVGGAATWNLAGVPVDATNPSTLLVTDRANYVKWSSGTALALPAVATSFASNLPFSLQNIEGATLTITPNAGASDLIDGAASGTLLNNFAMFLYQDGTTAPGHWWSVKFPTFAAFPACADSGGNHLNFATTTGFSCGTSVPATVAPLASPTFTGTVTLPLLATTTNCAAAGTSANPSVVSCSAAPAGSFSCDPAASTGTCQVNTSAVTTNSEVFIQPRAAAPSLTCNASSDTGVTKPRLASVSNGASFTINLGTFSATAECFSYFIVN